MMRSLILKTGKMKTVLIFFVLLAPFFSFSQKAIIREIRAMNPVDKEKYIFPEIIIPGNTASTHKINKKLRMDLLWEDESETPKNIFKNIWQTNDTLHTPVWVFTDFAYTLFSNATHFTCLSVSCVGGRYNQTNVYNFFFDNTTGGQVKLDTLLTEKGRSKLLDMMWNGQQMRIKKELASRTDSLKHYRSAAFIKAHKDYQEYIDDEETAIAKDKDCLQKSKSSNFEYYEFYVKKGLLFLEGEGCSTSRNDERIGVLGNYKFSIPVKSLQKDLSAYGKKLLL